MDAVTKVKTQYRKEQWMHLIKECQGSGLTIKDWCAQNDISENAYYYWLRRIGKLECAKLLPAAQNETPNAAIFVPLQINGGTNLKQEPVIIHILNADIEVRDDSSPKALEIVLSAFKNLC